MNQNQTASVINLDDIDLTADPGSDFYTYANHHYLETAVLPVGYPRWGSFDSVRELVLNQLHEMMQEASNNEGNIPGSNEQKIADFFASGMDEGQIESEGIKPLKPEFKRIERVKTLHGLAVVMARLHTLGANPLFVFGSNQSFDDSSMNVAAVAQSGLGMPERDYYLDADKKGKLCRKKYVAHIGRMLILLGEAPKMARRHARGIMSLETSLAKASMSKEDRRKPEKINNIMTVQELQRLVPSFPFKVYFSRLGAPAFDSLMVMQPEFFRALNGQLKETPLSTMRSYLRWKLISSTASYLSTAFVNESFEFYGKTLSGLKEQRPRWKRVVGTVDGYLGEALGQPYVAKHFPPEAKGRALDMIQNLKDVFRKRMSNWTWMSSETKQNGLAKLDKTRFMIGYPEKWLDYSSLIIERTSFIGNVLRSREFASRLDLNKIGQSVDRNEWGMTPQTVNAYSDSQNNVLCFPASMFQFPFFSFQADDAFNYARILMVIGHEFFHLFDPNGALFDADGNLRTWWQKADFEAFTEMISHIIEQYSNFQIGGEHVRGGLVKGEATADLGGLTLAYEALQLALAKTGRQTVNGFTDEQRFFIAFAQIWAEIHTPESAELQTRTDEHPLGQFRVNGTLAHLPEFAQAFGLPDDCPIMLLAEDRCQL
jgi:putative endopeptidase